MGLQVGFSAYNIRKIIILLNGLSSDSASERAL